MAHSQGHICQCLGRIQYLRRDSPLCITADRQRSGAEFVNGVTSLACGLSELGIRRGEVIAIAALNSDLYMEWFLAITYVGGIVAPLNYRWSFEEAKSALEIVSPVMLVLDESCISWALQLQLNMDISSLKLYAFIGDPSSSSLGRTENVLSMNAIRRHSQSIEALDISWAPKEIALICFTSGTTGRPKGVAISHTALIIQSLAKIAFVGYGVSPYSSSVPYWRDLFLCSLVTGRNANVLSGWETVNKILNGAGGLSSELINLATSIFPHAKILSAYGMTETCSSLTFITLRDPTPKEPRKVHSTTNDSKNGGVLVGKPAPHIELRISSGSDSPLGGSILTRGSHVMVGYCSQSMNIMLDSVEHGWLDTGDIGRIDGNGDLWLIGRKKDRIKSGGENVYPEEVEALLRQHPGVIDAVVISIPDIRLNEKVIACISLRGDWNWIDQSLSHPQGAKKLSSEILLTYCRQRNLTRYKIPKIFIPWRKPFPLTTTGKLKRDELRREALSYLQLLSSRL